MTLCRFECEMLLRHGTSWITFRRLHTCVWVCVCVCVCVLSAHAPLQVWVRDAVEAQYFLDYRTGRVWHKEQVHQMPNRQPGIILGCSTN